MMTTNKTAKCTCSCGATFYATNGELWCATCRPTVKPFQVKLSARQREQIEAQAIVRGVSPEQLVRDAITALCRPKLARLHTEQKASLQKPRAAKKPHTGKRRAKGRRRPLEP